jgi:hypothetical protein
MAGFVPNDGNASSFFNRPNIAARVRELVANAAAECGVTKETLTGEAEMNRLAALARGDIGKANDAVMIKAKLHGLIQERREHGGKDGGPIQVVAEVRWKSP